MKKYARDNLSNNFEEMVTDSDQVDKPFWQIMGNFMGAGTTTKKNTTALPPLKMQNSNYSFIYVEKANTLNRYFCSFSSIADTNII